MACGPVVSTDGNASFRMRDDLNQQIKKAENHLISIASIHGKDSPNYQRSRKALAASKLLYASLCGSEEPKFEVSLHG